jgi:hypothetical protein
MKRIVIFCFLSTIPLLVNEQGYAHEHRAWWKQQVKINYLYKNFLPTERDWEYKISKEVRS